MNEADFDGSHVMHKRIVSTAEIIGDGTNTENVPTPEEIRELFRQEETEQFLQHLSILLVFFHGSRAHGTYRQNSDYDFAVLLNDRVQWSFMERVERLDKLGEYIARKLSLSRDEVDIQDFDDMPLLMAFNIVGDGALVWEGEPRIGLCFQRQTYSRYQDFDWTERFFRKALREKLHSEKHVG
jgi:predicted nucleotidyltransferase